MERISGTNDCVGDLQEPLLQDNGLDNDEIAIEKDIILPSCPLLRRGRNDQSGYPPPPIKVNHNVALNLLICIVYGVADSLWSGTVIAAYLKHLGHNRNSLVGDVEAANGLANLISALPVGYLADKIGRAKVIRAGGILTAATVFLHIWLLDWIGVEENAETMFDSMQEQGHSHEFWYMGAVMAMWGIAGGVVNGPAQALYADSTPAGQRSIYYTYLFGAYVLSSCVGPLVSILLFQTLGDDWDLYHLRIVLFVGLGLEMVNAVLMMLFDDRKALEEKDENSAEAPERRDERPSHDDLDQRSTLAVAVECSEDVKKRRKYIPYIVFCEALIMSIGSGMTVKFFPLFFKDEVGMSPTQVQIIYVLVPLFMVGLSGVAQKLAKTGFGRVQSSLVLNTLGVFCLFSMVLFKNFLDANPFILVPIYVIRTSLMNCTYPLQESILMDFVPKSERARWKSLDSVAVFGWCGSAAFGGWLTDKYDYTYTFFITALIQSLGVLCFALLLPLVPRHEEDLGSNDDNACRGGDANAENTTTPSLSDLEEPLLNGVDE